MTLRISHNLAVRQPAPAAERAGRRTPRAAQAVDDFATDPVPPASGGGAVPSGPQSSLIAIAGRVRELTSRELSKLSPEELGSQIEELYLLQHRTIAASNQLSMRTEPLLKRRSLKLLQEIGDAQTAVFRQVVALANDMGPWVTYKNTMKTPGYHSAGEMDSYFRAKLRKFIERGGDLRQIQPLTHESLNQLQSGELAEWVVDEFDQARISSAEGEPIPGHVLLAWGQDVLSAGSLRLYKDENGEIQQVFVGSFSGHFRAGVETQQHVVRHLVAAGIPPERIILHEGEAAGARTLEILERALGKEGENAQRRLEELEAEARRYNPYESYTAPNKPTGGAKVSVPDGLAPQELSTALFRMRTMLDHALADAVIVAADGKAESVVASVEEVLELSERAGNRTAFGQAMRMLEHLAALPEGRVDVEAARLFATALERWKHHSFGSGSLDPARVLSAPPPDGRRTRLIVTVRPSMANEQLRALVRSGMDVARLSAGRSYSLHDLGDLASRVRKAAADVGRQVAVHVELRSFKNRISGELADKLDVVEVGGVRRPEDLVELRARLSALGRTVPVLLRVDHPALLEHLEQLAILADGFVVDRARLLDALGLDGVLATERRVHSLGNRFGKPTVLASEVVSSMRQGRARPSVAEAEALFQAITHRGIEGVLLDGETKHAKAAPEMIDALVNVIRSAETERDERAYRQARPPDAPSSLGWVTKAAASA